MRDRLPAVDTRPVLDASLTLQARVELSGKHEAQGSRPWTPWTRLSSMSLVAPGPPMNVSERKDPFSASHDMGCRVRVRQCRAKASAVADRRRGARHHNGKGHETHRYRRFTHLTQATKARCFNGDYSRSTIRAVGQKSTFFLRGSVHRVWRLDHW